MICKAAAPGPDEAARSAQAAADLFCAGAAGLADAHSQLPQDAAEPLQCCADVP